MKKFIPLLFLILFGSQGFGQMYDSKYAVFDRKVVLVKGIKESSELVCVVPKGNPVRIVERVGGPFYKAQYKDWKGYLISFNLDNRFKSDSKVSRSESVRIPSPEKLFVKVSRKTYITKKKDFKKDYKMIITVPKHETLEILDRVKRGKYLVRYKTHVGITDLNSYNVKDDVELAFLERMNINRGRSVKSKSLDSELIITEYKVVEVRKEESNKKIDLNEMLDLNFTIKNMGSLDANLDFEVISDQPGVKVLGQVGAPNVLLRNPATQRVLPGDYHSLTYRYYLSPEFSDRELKFVIRAIDRSKETDFTAEMIFPVHGHENFQSWKNHEAIARQTHQESRYPDRTLNVPLDVPSYIENVDQEIPVSKSKQKNTYALIIGNEDYRSRQRGLAAEQNAEFAIRDAEVFKRYCENTLGIPERQIRLLKNATAAEISQGLAWINNLSKIENGNANLIFYYSGHGLPDQETQSPVLLPVDVSANHVEYGVPLADAYASLVEHPARKITVFLDACFSGTGKNQGLLPYKGIKVRADKSVILGNMVVFSSSSELETSSVYREARHGYFTYFLLKKLKETRGNVRYDDLGSYLIRSVQKETGLNGIVQTPEVNASEKVADSWQSWKLK